MPEVVGIKLRYAGKSLSFDPNGVEPLTTGEAVLVSTSRGQEFGFVVIEPHEVDDRDLHEELQPVDRIATQEDWETYDAILADEDIARSTFRRMVADRGLDMKPLFAEWMFDRSKLVFYFVSEDRVDFRDLVKELATEFKTRIEMRQIGVRDEARMVGGYSHCGEQLCCSRFAGDFQPVSIRMAKEQDLPLNPTKISGTCGRLMCCLRYEFDAYKDFKQRAPRKNAMIDTPQGPGKVVQFDTPREIVTVRTVEGNLAVPLAAMSCGKGEEGCNCPCKVTAEALEEFAPKKSNAAMLGEVTLHQAAMVHPEEPAVAEKPAGGKGRGRARRGKGVAGEGAEAAAAAPAPAKSGGGRGGRGGKPKAKAGAGAPAGAAGGATPTDGEGGASSATRRRRRRGRGGKGGGGGGGGEQCTSQGQAPQPASGDGGGSAPKPEARRRRRSHGPGEGGGTAPAE
jgi:cell fate regulator YaaT (PSP1 superfamily)